jgi:hypothetical protein
MFCKICCEFCKINSNYLSLISKKCYRPNIGTIDDRVLSLMISDQRIYVLFIIWASNCFLYLTDVARMLITTALKHKAATILLMFSHFN